MEKCKFKEPTDKQLLHIARTHLDTTIPTLKTRKSDALDFHDVSVWGIEYALRAAYELGWNTRAGKEDK